MTRQNKKKILLKLPDEKFIKKGYINILQPLLCNLHNSICIIAMPL